MDVHWAEGFEHFKSDPDPVTSGTGQLVINDTNDFSIALEGLYLEINSCAVQKDDLARTGDFSLSLPTFGSGFRRALDGNNVNYGLTFGLYLSRLPTTNTGPTVFAQFRDDNNRSHTWLKVSTTGRIIAGRTGYDQNFTGTPTILGTSTLAITAGVQNHFEVRVKLDTAGDNSGFVKVRVNGRDFLSLTGINTRGDNATGDMAQVAFGQWQSSNPSELPLRDALRLDDLVAAKFADDGSEDSDWICGSDGSLMWGAYYLVPDADTATADWALTSGTHGYALVNEIEPDDDVAFIFSSTVDDKSAFVVEPLPAGITNILAVLPIARMRKTDTGAAAVALGVISSDATETMADDHPILTDYSWFFDVFQTDPATGVAWLPNQIPEIEVERTV